MLAPGSDRLEASVTGVDWLGAGGVGDDRLEAADTKKSWRMRQLESSDGVGEP
ncbi:MAG: hypothetical protein AAFR61_24520 [Bacteroidota bacterium]